MTELVDTSAMTIEMLIELMNASGDELRAFSPVVRALADERDVAVKQLKQATDAVGAAGKAFFAAFPTAGA